MRDSLLLVIEWTATEGAAKSTLSYARVSLEPLAPTAHAADAKTRLHLQVLRYMCARDLMISSTFCRGCACIRAEDRLTATVARSLKHDAFSLQGFHFVFCV